MVKKRDTSPTSTLSPVERMEQTSAINGQALTAGIARQVLIRYACETARDPKGYMMSDAADWAKLFSDCRAYLDMHTLPLHMEEEHRLALGRIMNPFLFDPHIWAQQGKVVFPESSLPLAVALYLFDEHHHAYKEAQREARLAAWLDQQADEENPASQDLA